MLDFPDMRSLVYAADGDQGFVISYRLGGTPRPVIVTIMDNKEYIRVL